MSKTIGKPKSGKQAEIMRLLEEHGELSRACLQSKLSWRAHRVSLVCVLKRMMARNMITVEVRNDGYGIQSFYKPVAH